MSWCCACLALGWVTALEYDMVYQTKCIMEEISENIIVIGDFSAVRKTDGTVVSLDVKVCAHRPTAPGP